MNRINPALFSAAFTAWVRGTWPDRSAFVAPAWVAIGGKTSRRSHDRAAGVAGRVVRGHWGIENRPHWVLDVTFNDDQSRLRTGFGAKNMAVVRAIRSEILDVCQPPVSCVTSAADGVPMTARHGG